jgi:hypothetical protein
VWQALHAELEPQGVTVVTVALDTGGPDAVRPFIEAAGPTHPSLVDEAHVSDELFGFVNVPMAVWIDEDGMIVRPAYAAHVQHSPLRDAPIPDDLQGPLRDLLTEVKKIRTDVDGHLAALRDWAANGSDSRFALGPDEVVARSQPRGREQAEAAACFELGQHLWRAGERDDGVRWFREAHRLDPANWTYKRQAWTFATTGEGQPSDLMQMKTDLYEGSWVDDVRRVGAENYYPDPGFSA